MFLGARALQRDWQVGDGREEAAAQAVLTRAPRGDLDATIATLDQFASREKLLINVGDEKGAILDQAIQVYRKNFRALVVMTAVAVVPVAGSNAGSDERRPRIRCISASRCPSKAANWA